MKVYEIECFPSANTCIEKDLKRMFVWFEEANIEDEIKIKVLEMSEEEYENLPEFEGP